MMGSAHIDYDPARRRPNTDSVSDWSKHRRRGPLALSQHGEERGRAVLSSSADERSACFRPSADPIPGWNAGCAASDRLRFPAKSSSNE
ncbi:hypothetical protein DTO207G8_7605 [Paecilomyces variotii]|nr:hypothetical protein DTO207G8_7605 [Paecilomyces variotii]